MHVKQLLTATRYGNVRGSQRRINLFVSDTRSADIYYSVLNPLLLQSVNTYIRISRHKDKYFLFISFARYISSSVIIRLFCLSEQNPLFVKNMNKEQHLNQQRKYCKSKFTRHPGLYHSTRTLSEKVAVRSFERAKRVNTPICRQQ